MALQELVLSSAKSSIQIKFKTRLWSGFFMATPSALLGS